MLKLEGFNSTIYSFNKKTGVSFTPSPQILNLTLVVTEKGGFSDRFEFRQGLTDEAVQSIIQYV